MEKHADSAPRETQISNIFGECTDGTFELEFKGEAFDSKGYALYVVSNVTSPVDTVKLVKRLPGAKVLMQPISNCINIYMPTESTLRKNSCRRCMCNPWIHVSLLVAFASVVFSGSLSSGHSGW